MSIAQGQIVPFKLVVNGSSLTCSLTGYSASLTGTSNLTTGGVAYVGDGQLLWTETLVTQ